MITLLEEMIDLIAGHELFVGDDEDGPSTCGCGLDEPDEVFYGNEMEATHRWHATHVVSVLACAGFGRITP